MQDREVTQMSVNGSRSNYDQNKCDRATTKTSRKGMVKSNQKERLNKTTTKIVKSMQHEWGATLD